MSDNYGYRQYIDPMQFIKNKLRISSIFTILDEKCMLFDDWEEINNFQSKFLEAENRTKNSFFGINVFNIKY